MKAYKITYGIKGKTNEFYKLKFSDAKTKYFEYKKHYMSIKDIQSYTENINLNGMLKDFWIFSAIIGNTTWEVSIIPIEIN